MQVINHRGYWGTRNDLLYRGDTLAELKLYPSVNNKYAELETGDCCVIVERGWTNITQVLVLSADKRVTINEDYEMLQLLLKSVVLTLTPKVLNIVSEAIPEALSSTMSVVNDLIESFAEPEKLTIKSSKPKKSDTTKLTQYMYDFTIYAHEDWKNFNRQNPKNKKTMEELTEAINTYMQTNKSRTTLGRVWNGHINRDDLPVGTAYFDYPNKVNDLS